MRVKRLMPLLLGLLLLLAAGPLAAGERLETITTSELVRLLAGPAPFLLINSLSPIEFDQVAIQGSVNIPAAHTRLGNPLLPADKDTALIFYCKGMRCSKSRLAARKAMGLGYRDVRVYMEGLPAWQARGLPVEKRVRYPEPVVPRLSPRQVYGARGRALILDIRGEEVRQLGSVPGGVAIPLDDLDQRFDGLPRDRLIIIVDHAGQQAPICSSFLNLHGYKDLAILKGGMVAWVRAGLPVTP
ncbi:MAG: rhodanese-like domain-containing protein [Thermodesulfobacteriota bacterium]